MEETATLRGRVLSGPLPVVHARSSAGSTITEQIIQTLDASQPPPAAQQTLTYTAGPDGSDLMLRLSTSDPSQLQIVDLRLNTVVASGALSQISGVRIIGADYANDSLKVDVSIPFSLKEGISFDGGKGGFDTLSVIGPKGGTVGYTPIGSSGGSI